jgi:hypothetical protein
MMHFEIEVTDLRVNTSIITSVPKAEQLIPVPELWGSRE